MALGGGTFIAQNKILPGSYINFVALSVATATLSDRGAAAMPLMLDWGVDGEVFEVTSGDFQKNSLKIFGYDFAHPSLKGLRDLFRNIRLGYFFRLGTGGAKAENTYATAKYVGVRGNALKIIVQINVDDAAKKDVTTILENSVIDVQTVTTAAELKNNDFVNFKTAATLTVTAGTALTGGANGTIANGDYQTFLDKVEGFQYNAIGCPSNTPAIKSMFAAFSKRLRDEQGVKFQSVVYNHAADYEGVVNVKNEALDETGDEVGGLVYWVTGVVAGTAVNKSALNKVYDGEYTPNVDYTQIQLENAIKAGEFTFHRVGNDIRVLADINSLVNETVEKNYLFKENQTIRVIDQIAMDIAALFSKKYLGVVPNDQAGRLSLKLDIVKHHEQLQEIRAIQDFSDEDVTVDRGNTAKAVVVNDLITVVNAMAQLYMTVVVA